MRIGDRARQYLRDFELKPFHQELGWDHHSQTLPIQVNEAEYTFDRLRQKTRYGCILLFRAT